MNTKEFSVGEALKKGWSTMKSHFWFYVLTIIVGTIISIIPYACYQWAIETGANQWIAIVASIVGFFISLMVSLGYINVSLRYVDGKKVHLGHFFAVFPRFFTYFISGILYLLLTYIGYWLVLLPTSFFGWWLDIYENPFYGAFWGIVFVLSSILGVYLAVKFALFPYFIVDKRAGPIEALEGSGKATTGAKWDLLALFILIAIVTALGALFFIIGLFAALPTTWVATAFVYRHLSPQLEEEA